MTITLTAEQQAWIDAHVASGEFASVEAAARSLIDAAIIERAMLDADDLAWAKPLVEKALAEVERGEVVSRKDYRESIASVLAKCRD